MRKTAIGFAMVFCIYSTFGSSVAHAYIPPSQFIIKTWANKHGGGGTKTIKIRSTVTAYSDDKPTEVHFKETAFFSADAQTLHSWASDDADRKLYSTEKTAPGLSTLSKLLLLADPREVARILRDVGIPIRLEEELLSLRTELERTKSESQSLARWNGGLAWVIGQHGPTDVWTPQLWIEKDTFLPLRMIYTSPKDREIYDFRFDGYRYSHEFPYPRNLIATRKGNGILFTSQIVELSVSSDHSRSHADSATGFTDASSSASSGVKDLIRLYYDVVR
jgi:hypothetical protein